MSKTTPNAERSAKESAFLLDYKNRLLDVRQDVIRHGMNNAPIGRALNQILDDLDYLLGDPGKAGDIHGIEKAERISDEVKKKLEKKMRQLRIIALKTLQEAPASASPASTLVELIPEFLEALDAILPEVEDMPVEPELEKPVEITEAVIAATPYGNHVRNVVEHTEHTYESLDKRISEIDSGWVPSSKEFKAMIEKFHQVGNPAELKNPIHRQVAMNSLVDTIQAYLDYKAPDNTANDPTSYSGKRVQFAKDMLEYAQNSIWMVRRNSHLTESLTLFKQFNDRCKRAVEDYQDPEKREAVTARILASDQGFVRDYRRMLDMAEQFADENSVQVQVSVMATAGSIAGFARLYNSIRKSQGLTQETDAMKDIGLSENDLARKRMVDERAVSSPAANTAKKPDAPVANKLNPPVLQKTK